MAAVKLAITSDLHLPITKAEAISALGREVQAFGPRALVDPNIQASALEFAQQKFHYNADALRIDWEWSDPEFAEHVSTPFLSQLDYLESDPSVRRIVVVTHVPIVEEQMHRDPSDPRWAFSNAYFGNLTLGRKVLAQRKVSHIISGHMHRGKVGKVEREDGPAILAFVVPSDYEKPDCVALSV